jgi:hypothetical protein
MNNEQEIHEYPSQESPSSTPWGLFIGRGEAIFINISIGGVKNYIQVLIIYIRAPWSYNRAPRHYN